MVPPQRHIVEQQLISHLSQYLSTISPSLICAYLATDGEPDIQPLFADYPDRLGLPRVDDDQMVFHHWQPGDPLVTNQWQIPEPSTSSTLVAPSTIDALLIPLVAYDASGNRLGRGGGYYDRYLEKVGAQTQRIGIAFSTQQAEQPLPTEPWDVPLTAVATELGVVEFAPSS